MVEQKSQVPTTNDMPIKVELLFKLGLLGLVALGKQIKDRSKSGAFDTARTRGMYLPPLVFCSHYSGYLELQSSIYYDCDGLAFFFILNYLLIPTQYQHNKIIRQVHKYNNTSLYIYYIYQQMKFTQFELHKPEEKKKQVHKIY